MHISQKLLVTSHVPNKCTKTECQMHKHPLSYRIFLGQINISDQQGKKKYIYISSSLETEQNYFSVPHPQIKTTTSLPEGRTCMKPSSVRGVTAKSRGMKQRPSLLREFVHLTCTSSSPTEAHRPNSSLSIQKFGSYWFIASSHTE